MKALICWVAALAFWCGTASAQTPPPKELPASNLPKVLPATTPLGSGPFTAIMEVDPTLAEHTVYRPNDMNAVGSVKLPIMAWGNGACLADGNSFRLFLTEIASHGYLIIANGPIGPDSAQFSPRMPPQSRCCSDRGSRRRRSSRYHLDPPDHNGSAHRSHRLGHCGKQPSGQQVLRQAHTAKVAVAGMSCGGVQAIEASVDPRVKTTIVANSGLLPTPTTMTGSGKPVPKESLQ
jgi:hypothetical protein